MTSTRVSIESETQEEHTRIQIVDDDLLNTGSFAKTDVRTCVSPRDAKCAVDLFGLSSDPPHRETARLFLVLRPRTIG